MKILVYSDFSQINHSVKPELEILLRLASYGHQLTVCSPHFGDTSPFDAAGITTVETGQAKKISPRAIGIVRKTLQAGAHDIVYATNSRSIPTAAFASIGLPVKLVCYRGTTRGLKRRDPTSFLTVLHPRVNAVLCVSNAVEMAVRKKLLRSSCRTTTIFKGHDLSWYTAKPASLAQFNIPAGSFVAVAAARFRPSKGLGVLLQASAELADLTDLHLLIVGSGADLPEYLQAIEKSPMRERIHLAGFRQDAPRIIAASHVLVQASVDGEGLPRAIMEALAYGIPAISTTAGGAKEIIEEGKTGYVVPVRDAGAIAARLRQLYLERDQLQAMSAACKAAIAGPLSCDASARAYESFFQSLLEQ